MQTALVIGATGVAGRSLLQYLEEKQDWNLIAVARRRPYFPTRATFMPVDLNDPDDCKSSLGMLKEITHVFYTAYKDDPVIANTREPNTRMFANVLYAFSDLPNLQHVNLLQGTKYYGQYLGPFKTPAKETDPRVSVPHFYYDQEDLLIEAAERRSWSWSCARPHVICGLSIGNPLNIISILAVYANLLKEAGKPLTFPGKLGAFTSVYQATDAALLAKALVWMSTTPACGNEAFNVTNGDFFRYQYMWPIFASYFGMESGGVETIDLKIAMASYEEVWRKIISRYGLQQHSLSELASWNFANFALSNSWDVMSDTTKLRKFGFFEFVDSEEMFLRYFDQLRAAKIVP